MAIKLRKGTFEILHYDADGKIIRSPWRCLMVPGSQWCIHKTMLHGLQPGASWQISHVPSGRAAWRLSTATEARGKLEAVEKAGIGPVTEEDCRDKDHPEVRKLLTALQQR